MEKQFEIEGVCLEKNLFTANIEEADNTCWKLDIMKKVNINSIVVDRKTMAT